MNYLKPPAIFAIDPGASGGLAILHTSSPGSVEPHPYTSPREIAEKLAGFHRRQMECWTPTIFVIEQVHASPVMSPSSAFAFGENYGIWRGLLARCALYGVTPGQWQRELGIPASVQGPDRKRALKKIASERYPEAHITLSTCDAVLIADYVRREIEAKGEFTSGKIL